MGRKHAPKPVYNDLYLGKPIGYDAYYQTFFEALVKSNIRVPYKRTSDQSGVLFLASVPLRRDDCALPWASGPLMQGLSSSCYRMLHTVRINQIVNSVWELVFIVGHTKQSTCKPHRKKQWRFFNPETQEVELYHQHPNDVGLNNIKSHEWYAPDVQKGMNGLWLYEMQVSFHTDETDAIRNWVVAVMNNLLTMNCRDFPCHVHWRDMYRESMWEPLAHTWIGRIRSQCNTLELPCRFQTLRAARTLEYAHYNQFFKQHGPLPDGHEVVCDDCLRLRSAVHPETKDAVFGCNYAHRISAQNNRVRPGYLLSRQCPRYMEHMMMADEVVT